MASLYKRARSPFWWIKYRDKSGMVVRKSTGFRSTDEHETRKARELRRAREADEDAVSRECDFMRWDRWVVPFLERRHRASPLTLARKRCTWSHLATYLEEKKIPTPLHLTRQYCLDYVEWRKAASINTIVLELRHLSCTVQEAVRRQWIAANPCTRLDIARETPTEKAELSDADIALIREAISDRQANAHTRIQKQNAQFLRLSFEIALAQGCRMAETHLDLRDVDLEHMEITFLAKGRKRYTAPLSPALVPLFEQLNKRKQRFTYVVPKMPSLLWWQLFREIRAKHPHLKRASFHSTRVTVVSRLGRAGVPERVAMALVNHSSTTIHRVYRRVNRSEIGAVWQALNGLGKHRPAETSDASPSSP